MKNLLIILLAVFFIFSCGEDEQSIVGNYEDTHCDTCSHDDHNHTSEYDLAHNVEHAQHHMDDDTAISIVADLLASDTINQTHIRYDISLTEKIDSLYTGKVTVFVEEATDVIFFGNKAIKILLLDEAGNVVKFKDHQHFENTSVVVTFIYELSAGYHTFQLGAGPSKDSTYSVVFENYKHSQADAHGHEH